MNGRKTEIMNNTPEQVRAYLTEALAIVEECDVPDDLRDVALTSVLNLVSGKQILMEQIQPGFPTMAMPRGPGL